MTLRAQAYANAALFGLLAFLVAINGNIASLSFAVFLGFALLFIVSGRFAEAGNRHVLAGTWAALIAGLAWFLWAGEGAGFMDGGLFVVVVFAYLFAGLVSALRGLDGRSDPQ